MLKHISIVDDDYRITQFISVLAKKWGYAAKQYTDVLRFINIDHNPQEVIMLDLNMPVLDGLEVIRQLAQKKCRSALVLMTGHDERILRSAQILCKEYNLQCLDVFTKPIKISKLKNLLARFNQSLTPAVPPKIPPWLPDKYDLQRAMDNNELLLHFQPQVNIKSGLVNRVEALVRWLHPQHGLIYPDQFIPLAEQEGLIDQLTQQVIEMAVWEGQNWWGSGKGTKISINISAHNICNIGFFEYLIRMFHDNGLSTDQISLEITESQLMMKWGGALNTLTRLRMKGFSLSIDDFGTGYSSFSHLHKIPFSEIKIDKSFVMSMTQDPTARAIVESCVLLSHKLGMTCVAEGVESQQHLALLAAMGCDMAQGYYFARPMPAKELPAWLNHWHRQQCNG